jgi:hypothetical protein
LASLKITYNDPAQLRPRARNPRTHTAKQIRQIQASIKEFGFINPILIDGNRCARRVFSDLECCPMFTAPVTIAVTSRNPAPHDATNWLRTAKMAPIDFDYDLEEIVQMDGVGPVSLKSALTRMPDPIGPYGVLHRERGKTPAFFGTFQIQALLNRHRSELNEGNRPGHPTRMIFSVGSRSK